MIVLLDDEFALRAISTSRRLSPGTNHRRPEQNFSQFSVTCKTLVGIPVADGKGIGDDARAGFESQQLRPQPDIHLRREKQHHHSGFGEVRIENIAALECRAIADPLLGRQAFRQLDQLAIVLDAMGARAALRRGDDVAAIAGTEIDDVVLGVTAGDIEHFLHHRLGITDPDDIFTELARLGLIGFTGEG